MARHERQPGEPGLRLLRFWRRFAVVWTTLWSAVTIGVLVAAIPEWTGLEPVPAEDIEAGIIAAVICAFMTGAGWLTAWLSALVLEASERPARPPLISTRRQGFEVEKRHQLPSPESAARQPVRQLGEVENVLAELLSRLGELPDAPAEQVAEHAWHVATDTAASLRSVAARLEAVELAAKHAPPHKQAALGEVAGSLRRHLDQGLDAYRDLIAAVGLLAGSAPVQATDELVEATERLAALVAALDELVE